MFIHCLWVNHENFPMQMTHNNEHNNAGFTKWLEILSGLIMNQKMKSRWSDYEFQCKQGT